MIKRIAQFVLFLMLAACSAFAQIADDTRTIGGKTNATISDLSEFVDKTVTNDLAGLVITNQFVASNFFGDVFFTGDQTFTGGFFLVFNITTLRVDQVFDEAAFLRGGGDGTGNDADWITMQNSNNSIRIGTKLADIALGPVSFVTMHGSSVETNTEAGAMQIRAGGRDLIIMSGSGSGGPKMYFTKDNMIVMTNFPFTVHGVQSNLGNLVVVGTFFGDLLKPSSLTSSMRIGNAVTPAIIISQLPDSILFTAQNGFSQFVARTNIIDSSILTLIHDSATFTNTVSGIPAVILFAPAVATTNHLRIEWVTTNTQAVTMQDTLTVEGAQTNSSTLTIQDGILTNQAVTLKQLQDATNSIPGDNLGNHLATQNLNMASFTITNLSDAVETNAATTLRQVQIMTNIPAIYAQLSSSIIQNPATNGPVVITYNTQDEISGLIHSTGTLSGEITIDTAGVYYIMAQPQVGKTSGASKVMFDMFLQIDTGGGFADKANSNIKLTIKDMDLTDVIVVGMTLLFNVGDKIRFMQRIDDTGVGLGLKPTAAEVGPPSVPATPSIIFTMYRVGG